MQAKMGSNEQELIWSLPSTPTNHPPQQLFLAVSQLPVARSEHVRTLFDSTQPQEYKSAIDSYHDYRDRYNIVYKYTFIDL